MCIFEAAQGFALHAGTFRRSGQPCYSPARQQRRNLPPLFSVFFFLNRDYLDKVSTVCCFFCRLSNSQFFFFSALFKGFSKVRYCGLRLAGVLPQLCRKYTVFFFFYTRYYYYDVLCSCFCLNEREKKTLYLLSFAFFIHVTTKIGNATFCFFGALLLLRTLLRPLLLVNQQFFFFFTIHLALFFFIKLKKRQDKSTLKHTHTHTHTRAVKTKLFDRTKSRNCF